MKTTLTLLASLATSAALAAGYSIQGLDFTGAVETYGYGLNDHGVVVGYGIDAGGVSRAFSWQNGVSTALSPLATSSEAYRINNKGQIVGKAATGAAAPHATLWDTDGATDLGTLGGDHSFANDINEAGVVAGSAGAEKGSHAFIWTKDGGMVDYGNLNPDDGFQHAGFNGINESGLMVGTAYRLFTPYHAAMAKPGDKALSDIAGPGRYSASMAMAVNDAGTIVGWSNNGSGNGHAAILNGDGTYLDLGSLGLDESRAFDINEAGDIVGEVSGYDDEGFAVGAAFLYTKGTMVNLNDLLPTGTGWDGVLEAHGINNKGQIVGVGLYGGEIRGFVLTPEAVPEPASMAALGYGALAVLRRRARR
ncbi:DUF3466 family protein [bacterium]|nr:MAG: DUF3466 family protein [bacterium]